MMIRKTLIVAWLLFLTSILAFSAQPKTTVILQTEKLNDAVHWMPETIKVKQGENVEFILKHNLQGGFDFHGFSIDALKLEKQVNRHKTLVVNVKIPDNMAPGEYPIRCQFHPKHVAAKLIVEKK
jgi:plastocyanin